MAASAWRGLTVRTMSDTGRDAIRLRRATGSRHAPSPRATLPLFFRPILFLPARVPCPLPSPNPNPHPHPNPHPNPNPNPNPSPKLGWMRMRTRRIGSRKRFVVGTAPAFDDGIALDERDPLSLPQRPALASDSAPGPRASQAAGTTFARQPNRPVDFPNFFRAAGDPCVVRARCQLNRWRCPNPERKVRSGTICAVVRFSGAFVKSAAPSRSTRRRREGRRALGRCRADSSKTRRSGERTGAFAESAAAFARGASAGARLGVEIGRIRSRLGESAALS